MSRDNANQIPVKSSAVEIDRITSIFIKMVSMMFSPDKLQEIEFRSKFDGVVENYMEQVDALINENTSDLQKENARERIRVIFSNLIEEKLSERETAGIVERTVRPTLIDSISKILMEKMDAIYSNSLSVEENAKQVLESVIATMVNTLMVRHQNDIEAIVANNIKLGISTAVTGTTPAPFSVDAEYIKNMTGTLVDMTLSLLIMVRGESPSFISGLFNFDRTQIFRSIISSYQNTITERVSAAVVKVASPARRGTVITQTLSLPQKINGLYRNILLLKNPQATESEKKSSVESITSQLQELIEPKFKKIFPETTIRDFVLRKVIELIMKKIVIDSSFRELDERSLQLIILGVAEKLIRDNLILLTQIMPAIASQGVINEVFEHGATSLRKTLTLQQKAVIRTIVNNMVGTAFSLSPDSSDKEINPFRALRSIQELVVDKMMDELLEERVLSPKKSSSSAFSRLSNPLLLEIVLLSDPSSSPSLKKAPVEKIKEIIFKEVEPQLIYSSAGMVKTKVVNMLIGEVVDTLVALHDKEKLTETLQNIFLKIKTSLETSDQFTVSDVEKIIAAAVQAKLFPQQLQLHAIANDKKSRTIFDVAIRTMLLELLKIGVENSTLLWVVSGDDFLSFLSTKILDEVVFKDPLIAIKERCGSDLNEKTKEQEAKLVQLKQEEIAAFDCYDKTRAPEDNLKFLLAQLKYKAKLFSAESENATGFLSSFQKPDIDRNLQCANYMISFIDNELKGAAQATGLPRHDLLRSDDLKSICVNLIKALRDRAAVTAASQSGSPLRR